MLKAEIEFGKFGADIITTSNGNIKNGGNNNDNNYENENLVFH